MEWDQSALLRVHRETKMRTGKIVMIALVGFVLLMIMTPAPARADGYYYCCNPLFLPFAVAGAVVGTAAAIVAAPFTPYPYYYGPGYYAPPPPPRYSAAPAYYGPGPYPRGAVWVPGHFVGSGDWIPGHWQ